MPAFSSISTPTEFATWKESAALFDDDVEASETCVYDGPEPGSRHAYGKDRSGFWFFISMTVAEELEFWGVYLAWRQRAGIGLHSFLAASAGTRPPICGTANTPPCATEIEPSLASSEPLRPLQPSRAARAPWGSASGGRRRVDGTSGG